MSKEKVFIVISHKRVLKKNNRVGSRKPIESDWEMVETIEFVNHLKKQHITMSSSTADYLNRKLLSGQHLGMESYDHFENYIETKYPKQLAELDVSYKEQQVKPPIAEKSPIAEVELEPSVPLFTDEFGNVRARTIFDHA